MRVLPVAVAISSILASVAIAAAATPEARAKDLVQRWVDAQNKGDFAAYSALYAPTFHGMRQSQGLRTAVDRDAWLRDHGRLFKKKMVVKVDSIAVTGGPTTRVDLVETLDTERFEDRGKKRLQLVERNGHLLIDYEEVLQTLSPEGPAAMNKCNHSTLGAGGGDVVLESCVAGEIKVEPDAGAAGVDKRWKTTLKYGSESTPLAEVASGWEWDDSWRVLGVVTSNSHDREQAVVLQRVREDIGDDAAWPSSLEVRALVHGLPTIWSTHDMLVGAQVSIEGDHVTVTARHAPAGTPLDEPTMSKLMKSAPKVMKLAYKKDKIVEAK